MIRIELHDEGVIVKDPISVNMVKVLSKFSSSLGFKTVDAGLNIPLEAVLVFTSAEGSKLLRAKVEEANKNLSAEDAWMHGCDTGVSSLTIFSVMTGRNTLGVWSPNVPMDHADFGRCFRLLKKFPAWRERLGEVAEKYPDWKELVEHWSEFERLYTDKNFNNLYESMKKTRGKAC